MAKARVSFRAHLLAYVIVNAFLVAIWWFTTGGLGTFWPMWPLLGWAIGLAFHGYGAYGGGIGAVSREEEKLRQKFGQR